MFFFHLQDIYETCKESILNRMRDTLAQVLVLPEEHESDEELHGICRAYRLLLNASGISKSTDHKMCSKKVSVNLNSYIFAMQL